MNVYKTNLERQMQIRSYLRGDGMFKGDKSRVWFLWGTMRMKSNTTKQNLIKATHRYFEWADGSMV